MTYHQKSLFGAYLTKEALINIKNYTYRSAGSTHMDIWMNHWWQFCADRFLPRWLAPNCITLGGFLASVCAGLLLMVYNPDLTAPMPQWTYWAMCGLLFLYQTLDAIDGKQARQTGCSSPLGQVFDHGCDTFTTLIVIFVAIGTARLGTSYIALGVILAIQAQLLMFCWWDLYFHVFPHSAGVVGVTEGQFFVMGMCVLAGTFGSEFFVLPCSGVLQYLPACLQRFVFVPATSSIAAPLGCLAILVLTWTTLRDVCCGLTKTADKVGALKQIVFFIVYLLAEVFFAMSGIVHAYPRHALTVMMLTSSTIAIRIELAAVGKMRLSPIVWPVVPFMVAAVTLFIGCRSHLFMAYRGLPFVILAVIEAWQFLYLTDFITTSIDQICSTLEIECFRIYPKHHDETKVQSEARKNR